MHGASSKAKSVCSHLGKPSEADARVLSTLFPSVSRPTKRNRSEAFDPLADCVVSAQKQKKKAVRIKPRKVNVVLIGESSIVPRFSKRRALKKDGSIKQLSFLRSMSSRQVRNTIVRGFSEKITEHEAERIVYLQSDPHTHTLTKIEKQECDGDDVIDLAGQGSLYIRLETVLVICVELSVFTYSCAVS